LPAFQTPAAAPRWKRWLVYSPLARIVIFALLASGMLMLLSLLAAVLGLDAKDAPAGPRGLSIFLRHLIPFLGMYLVLVHFIERRRPEELAWSKVVPHGLLGLAAGFAFISSVVGILWLAGAYTVTGTRPDVDWVRPLLSVGLATALAEEIVFRGVLFRITEEGLGTWPALLVSAALFGGIHMMNRNATIWSSVAIAIEAGVVLGLVYHVSRSLPLVIGIHMAWNFGQGTIYGIPVSGSAAAGLLVSERPGPDWLTGGIFGAEASVVAVVISLLASAVLVAHARRSGSIVVRGRRTRRIMESPPRDVPC
jgi:membrane protease YdiL (CAAX protease family)